METNVIVQGDCLQFMKSIPNDTINLIVTDPPYLMRYKTNYRKDKHHKFCTEILGDNDENLIAEYVKNCFRILKDNSSMYIFCNVNRVDFFKQCLESAGFKIKNMIVWVKNRHTAGDLIAQYGKKYELIFYVNKGRCPIIGKRLTDVWEFPRVSGKQLVHQNQKPIDLIRLCIEKSLAVGDVVFDGFMGSGTTAIAAIESGRRYIGCEIDPDYFAVAKQRIADAEKVHETEVEVTGRS